MNLRTLSIMGALGLSLGLLVATDGTAAQRRPVWERVDQFIAVEQQDSSAPANEHPAQLRADQLRATLAPLRVVMDKGEEPVRLFTDGELDTLSDGIRSALVAARPTEDVTFAVIGLHGAFLGLFKQPMVTTGRLFIRQGKINLILGQVHEPVNDREDRRLKPFVPGSRTQSSPHRWQLAAKSGKSLTFAEGRTDWLNLDLVTEIPAPPLPKAETEDSYRPQPATPQESPVSRKSVEERLRTLKDLHQKNLITDEEYQAKRKEILSEI